MLWDDKKELILFSEWLYIIYQVIAPFLTDWKHQINNSSYSALGALYFVSLIYFKNYFGIVFIF